jgi:hypothetical protein
MIERSHGFSLYNFGKDRTEITTSNSFSIIMCLSVAAKACLASRCLAIDVSAVLLWLHTSGLQVSCHNVLHSELTKTRSRDIINVAPSTHTFLLKWISVRRNQLLSRISGPCKICRFRYIVTLLPFSTVSRRLPPAFVYFGFTGCNTSAASVSLFRWVQPFICVLKASDARLMEAVDESYLSSSWCLLRSSFIRTSLWFSFSYTIKKFFGNCDSANAFPNCFLCK